MQVSEVEIIMWMIGLGFTALGTLIIYLNSTVNGRLDKIQENVTDIDRRLCRLEGAFASKELCVLKNSNTEKAQ